MPVKINQSKQYILDFLSNHSVGVLATSDSSNHPHAAAVYIFHDDEMNIYFMTKEGTQKGKDLNKNPRASLVVYDEKDQTTLQAKGSVGIIENSKQANEIFNNILKISLETSKADPPVSKVLGGGYQACKFTPGSIRLASYKRPPEGDWQNIFASV